MRARVHACLLLWLGLPAAVRPERFFSVVRGTCYADEEGCFYSPGYPNQYNNHESCELYVIATTTLAVVTFRTEYQYDSLKVNSNRYSGTNGPSGVTVATGESLFFTSDLSVSASGFKICDAASWCAAGSGIVVDSPFPDYYSGRPLASTCTLCAKGAFSESAGTFGCSVCPRDTFSADKGATQCELCPSGKTSKPGSKACLDGASGGSIPVALGLILFVCPAAVMCSLMASKLVERRCKRNRVAPYDDDPAGDSDRRSRGLSRERREGGGVAMVALSEVRQAQPMVRGGGGGDGGGGYGPREAPLAVAVPVAVGEAIVLSADYVQSEFVHVTAVHPYNPGRRQELD